MNVEDFSIRQEQNMLILKVEPEIQRIAEGHIYPDDNKLIQFIACLLLSKFNFEMNDKKKN